MKKVITISLYFSLFFTGNLAQAFFLAPSANLTIVVNTDAHDGLFQFVLQTVIGIQGGQPEQFDLQTDNSTASRTMSVIPGSNVTYWLTEKIPDGYGLMSASCMSDNDRDTFQKIPNGINIKPSNNSNITCVFNNSEIVKKTPVLIIPGIMGTEIFKGGEKLWPDVGRMLLTNNDRFMDSLEYQDDGSSVDTSLQLGNVISKEKVLSKTVLDYTENLTLELIMQHYTPGVDLFLFPYDWRRDLDHSAQNELKQTLDNILTETGANKIDIVAHSQGGLVIKRLLYNQPNYDQKIDKLVFVGTPNLGAPQAAKALLYGDSMGIQFLNLGLDPTEVQRITLNMPAIYELLPSREYLSHGQNYLASANFTGPLITSYKYLNYDEAKQTLKDFNLNSNLIDQAESFHAQDFDNFDLSNTGIQAYNIMGCQTATITGVLAGKGKYRIVYGPGDGTVPLISASNVFGAQDFYAKKANHGTMLTDNGTRQLIVNLISGSNLKTNNISRNSSECKFDGKKISVHSPVEIQIYDAEGNHAGPVENGFENNIPGVQYDIIDQEKFIFLPTDDGQQYSIQGKGSDTGSFDLLITDVTDTVESQSSLFDNVKIIPGSSLSFTVSDNSDDSHMNFDYDKSGSPQTLSAASFNSEDEAFAQAVSVDQQSTPPSSSSEGGGISYIAKTPAIQPAKILGESIIHLPDGTLVLDSSDGRTVYMIGDGGKKYGFTSGEVFIGQGFSFSYVQLADISSYTLGGLISATSEGHPGGTLVTDGHTVWQIQNGQLFGFPTMEIFRSYGFGLKTIVKINPKDKLLNKIN